MKICDICGKEVNGVSDLNAVLQTRIPEAHHGCTPCIRQIDDVLINSRITLSDMHWDAAEHEMRKMMRERNTSND